MKPVRLYAFADEASRSMAGQLHAMTRNGLDGLEIRGVDGVNISDISRETAKEVRRMLDDHGLITWSIGSPIGKIPIDGDFEAHLELFRHTLEIADILGAKNLRMFSFYIPENGHKDSRRKVVDRLGQLLEVSHGSGIALCHENEKGIYGDIADRCLEIHQALPELKGVFDPANFVQCGEDTLRAWALLKNHIHYLHIKDALPDGSVVPAGKGCGNVAFIVGDYLARDGRAMTVEPHLSVFDGLAALEQGNRSCIGGQAYTYPSADAAFDAACDALKSILKEY